MVELKKKPKHGDIFCPIQHEKIAHPESDKIQSILSPETSYSSDIQTPKRMTK